MREGVLLGLLLGLYSAVRLVAAQDVSSAFTNADRVLRAEQWLHLPAEQHLQDAVLAWRPLARAANAYYASAHLPVTAAALCWLFLRSPAHYRWARRALITASGAAVVAYVLIPTAPPRMLGSLGFVDVGQVLGQSVYSSRAGRSFTDQYAAMPSLHVGWAVLVAAVCISAGSSRWRWVWVAHPVVTMLVVVGTANHYWLDGVVGAGLVTGALLIRLPSPAPAHHRDGAAPRLQVRARC